MSEAVSSTMPTLGDRALLGRRELRRCGVDGERAAADGREIVGRGRLRPREAVVREEDEAGGAEAARGLDVLDRLRGGEPIRADAGPHAAAADDVARGGDLFGEARRLL